MILLVDNDTPKQVCFQRQHLNLGLANEHMTVRFQTSDEHIKRHYSVNVLMIMARMCGCVRRQTCRWMMKARTSTSRPCWYASGQDMIVCCYFISGQQAV